MDLNSAPLHCQNQFYMEGKKMKMLWGKVHALLERPHRLLLSPCICAFYCDKVITMLKFRKYGLNGFSVISSKYTKI